MVVTAQEMPLSDQQSTISIQQDRMVASVALIHALGNGWTIGDVPSHAQIRQCSGI